MPSISVIIPAYNAASTIRRCLDSVFSIPLNDSDLEVIVVDDCSTDDTFSILAGYSNAHGNLVVARQEFNQRQGAARNRGLDLCSGEYVLFVDSDDTVVVDGIVYAVEAAKHYSIDICYFDFEYQTEDGNWHKIVVPDEIRNSVIDSSSYLENHYSTFFNGPWRSLYKSSLLKETGIRFVEGVQWEDCDWTIKILSRAKTIQLVDGVGYRYHFNANSTIKQKTARAMSNRVYAGLRLMSFSEEVEDCLPKFSERIFQEGRNQYVLDVLRLRNLTKYSFGVVSELSVAIGESRTLLLDYQWPFWVCLFLRFKIVSLAFLSLACPVARLVRVVIRSVRGL